MSTKSKFLAYGPERHAVETVMRLHAVKRWHMIDTTRQQTLAEHSANVALLAMMITRTAPINIHLDNHILMAAAALVHDVEEAFTGDIPSHTKRMISGLEVLENEIVHPAMIIQVNVDSSALIKLCDLADGIRFVRLHGVDLTAEHAKEGLEDQLLQRFHVAEHDLEWPKHLLHHVKNHIMFYAYEIS